ncbi:MAG TPA: ImmA/IrrE family metallo-endopeptidase [Paludibacter sp.]
MISESSTSKGTKFENEVFTLIEKLVKTGKFFVPNKGSKVFQKKSYYSEKRKAGIIFDITIETYIENAPKYSILTIIECKNVNRPVSIDDIEELSSKIAQVGEHRTKGIIISTNTFQSSTLNYAYSTGIALIRIVNNKNFEWVTYRKDCKINSSNREDIELKLCNNQFSSQAFVCFANNYEIPSFSDLLLEYKVIDYLNVNEEFIKIPFITEVRFNYIIARLDAKNVYDGYKLNVDRIIELLEQSYGVEFKMDTVEDESYLGKITFEPLVIKIAKKTRDDLKRWRFTIAHEIGHLILHKNLLLGKINEKNDSEDTLQMKYVPSQGNIERIELQANLFAGYLLLPDTKLKHKAIDLFNEHKIKGNQLYIDHQSVNRIQAQEILNKLSSIFEVSIEAIKIRLIKLNLLVDDSDTRIKTLIRKNEW